MNQSQSRWDPDNRGSSKTTRSFFHSARHGYTHQNGEGWWYRWIEEVPDVNAQQGSRDELILALREGVSEALEMNRRDALESAERNYTEERIAL